MVQQDESKLKAAWIPSVEEKRQEYDSKLVIKYRPCFLGRPRRGVYNQMCLLTVFAASASPSFVFCYALFICRKKHKINYTLYLDLTRKFCEFGFIIFCFQIRKLRLRKGQWFEPVSSLTPELCALPCPPYGARLECLVSVGSGWCFSCSTKLEAL